MKRPTIACCYFVHDDLSFLRATLSYDKKWADQICILDLGSTDGTKEFCELYLDRNDKYERRTENTCPDRGFSEAKNACCALATTDWVFYGAADQMLRPSDHGRIHNFVAEATQPVLSVDCINILPQPSDGPTTIESGIVRANSGEAVRIESHRRIIRQGMGVLSKGYLHEEPFLGELNCFGSSGKTDLAIYHFSDWANSGVRRWRYSWMFKRALNDPELQRYTNRWWYDDYVAKHKDFIDENAALYEKYVAETGRK